MLFSIEFYEAFIASSIAFFLVKSLVRRDEGKFKDYAGNLIGIGSAFGLWFVSFSFIYFLVNPLILGVVEQTLSNVQSNDIALILLALSIFAFMYEVSDRASH